MSKSVYKNLQMFARLCGDTSLPRTRLVTTMWDIVEDRALARDREDQLKCERGLWQTLIDGGAIAKRFDNTSASAWDIVEGILRMGKDGDELLLQEELVEEQKHLNETEAGKILYTRLQKLLAEQRKMIKELAEEAKLQNDPVLAKSLQHEYDKIDTQLQNTFEEMKDIKIPLSRRIRLWLFTRKSRAVSPARCLAAMFSPNVIFYRKLLSRIIRKLSALCFVSLATRYHSRLLHPRSPL